MEPHTPELRRLVKRLYERLAEEIIVPCSAVSLGDWKPALHHCHENVDRWVEANPRWKAVRAGYFLPWMIDVGCPQFLAHSVVESEAEKLVDIMPNNASMPYPFIRHKGANHDFKRLIEGFKLIRLNYRTRN